jgi:hypothetical protein
LFEIFVADILPVFLIAAVGFLLARFAAVDVRALARVSLHGLAPVLIFDLLVTSPVAGAAFGRVVLLCILVIACLGALGRLLAIPLGLDRSARMAFLLVVMFANGGNYGLPVTLFAFGREALVFATIYFVTSSILTYTLGVMLAGSGRTSVRSAVIGVFRIPAIYALAAAGLVLWTGAGIPAPVSRAVGLLSGAALPVMILVLGMQLERASMPSRPLPVLAAAMLSLVISPLIAVTGARLLGLTGPALQAGVLQASMPTAVVTTVIALEFDLEPTFVTSVVVASTLISPFTIAFVISRLQGA